MHTNYNSIFPSFSLSSFFCGSVSLNRFIRFDFAFCCLWNWVLTKTLKATTRWERVCVFFLVHFYHPSRKKNWTPIYRLEFLFHLWCRTIRFELPHFSQTKHYTHTLYVRNSRWISGKRFFKPFKERKGSFELPSILNKEMIYHIYTICTVAVCMHDIYV